jgi:hypothetical protein
MSVRVACRGPRTCGTSARSCSAPSVAAQKLVVGQDTELRSPLPSIGVQRRQALPLWTTARVPPTATQKLLVAQDTDAKPTLLSVAAGVLHCPPLSVMTRPEASTAAQNPPGAQEMAVVKQKRVGLTAGASDPLKASLRSGLESERSPRGGAGTFRGLSSAGHNPSVTVSNLVTPKITRKAGTCPPLEYSIRS